MKLGIRRLKHGIRHLMLEIRHLRLEMQRLKLEMRCFRHGMRRLKHGIQRFKLEMRRLKHWMWHLSLQIVNFSHPFAGNRRDNTLIMRDLHQKSSLGAFLKSDIRGLVNQWTRELGNSIKITQEGGWFRRSRVHPRGLHIQSQKILNQWPFCLLSRTTSAVSYADWMASQQPGLFQQNNK